MKKRFFKAVAAVTAMTLVSGIFTGCGNSGSGKDGSSGNGELVFVDWGGANTDARIASAVKPYEEAQIEDVRGAEIYTSVISWNSDKTSAEDAPQTWADFFDTEKYPGKRAVWQYPVTVLEAALLADGVPMDELYPLDLDRAFAKLDTIKDDIVWWTKGAEPSQMLSTGEADYALAWSGRIATAKDEGSPVDMHYNGGIMISAGWVVPKNAPNKENAMKFIEFISEAPQQYGFSELIPYGSTNPEAVALMSDEMKVDLGQSDEQLENEIYLNNTYWAENLSSVEERFNAWLLE